MNSLEKAVERTKKRIRGRYAYAKSLGFTGAEAGILQNWSMTRIDALVREKAAKDVTSEGGR